MSQHTRRAVAGCRGMHVSRWVGGVRGRPPVTRRRRLVPCPAARAPGLAAYVGGL